MYLDLHVHTTASDGQYTPTEIITKAKELGLEMVAVTDHDTVDGIAEAKLAALELQVEFVPGIEISTQDTEEVHILGLGIDHENVELVETCKGYAESREKRAEKICEYLGTKRIKVTTLLLIGNVMVLILCFMYLFILGCAGSLLL